MPGHSVQGHGGWRGVIDPEPVSHEGVAYAVLRLEGEEPILVPVEMLRRTERGDYFLPATREDLLRGSEPAAGGRVSPSRAPAAADGARELVVPVVTEELDIQTQTWATGGVRVRVEVRERQEVVDQPLVREEVRVERVPVNQVVTGEPPGIRQEGDVVIVPVLEEVLVVEKRLVLKEEVRISKRRFEAHEPQTVSLREEAPVIERLTPDEAPGTQRDAA